MDPVVRDFLLSEPPEAINVLTEQIITAAFEVHTQLGPGLLESCYHGALLRELRLRDLAVRSEVPIVVDYKGHALDVGYRADMIVENAVVVELKAVRAFEPIHFAQTITYLRHSGCRVALLLNFGVPHMREGIKRFAC